MDSYLNNCFLFAMMMSMNWWWTICCQYTTCLNEEILSLLAVKDALNRSPRLCSWKGFNCCEWEVIHCNKHSLHVVEIDLHEFLPRPSTETDETNGVINPALFEFKHLEYLDLIHNYLTGDIPAGLFQLQKLKHLDLSENIGSMGIYPRNLTP
eukprot:Gb_23078 [translate_table: standard]